MMRTTVPVPTAVGVTGCGVVLAAAGLLGWHLGAAPAESPRQRVTPSAAAPAARPVPVVGPRAQDAEQTPAPAFGHEQDRRPAPFDQRPGPMPRVQPSMPLIRERADHDSEQRKALEAKWNEQAFLSRPLYIEPSPGQ